MKTLTVLREEGHALYSRVIQKIIDLRGIIVTAKEPSQPCELCQGPMRVQKPFDMKEEPWHMEHSMCMRPYGYARKNAVTPPAN